MSFAQMVSIALSGVLQTLRDNQIIPDRAGWEYDELVSPYINKQNGRKLEVTKVINSVGSELSIKGLSMPAQVRLPGGYVEPEMTAEQRRAWARIAELQAKQELAETEGSGIIWGASDQAEYDRLAALV